MIIDNHQDVALLKQNILLMQLETVIFAIRLGLETYTNDLLQPPTTCAHLEGCDTEEFNNLLKQHQEEFNPHCSYLSVMY